MSNKKVYGVLAVSLLLVGCTNVLVRDESRPGLPRLTATQISNAGLSGVKDNVYVVFDGSCPIAAVPVVPQCSPSVSNAICRAGGAKIKFTPIPDDGTPNPSFGIEFETEPSFDPCVNSVGNVAPGVKNCNVKAASSWPGDGAAPLLIKYTVKSASGTCDLDPYLVLRR